MSKISYQGANVETSSDSFGGWINKTNQIIFDMGTVVMTVAAVAQPNTTNGGQTTGNAHIEGILSSNTMAVKDGLRGGTVSFSDTLDIVSNTHFKDSDEVRFENIDLVHIMGQSNTVISGDLNLDGLGKQAKIALGSGNTTFESGEVYSYANVIIDTSHVDITAANTNIHSNTIFTTSFVHVDASNTTIGSSNTQSMLVKSNMSVTGFAHFFEQSRFDANVDFYSQEVVFHNDMTIGSDSTDSLVVNSGVSSDIIPSGAGHDLGSVDLPWQEIHGVDLHADGVANIGGIFSLYGGSARQAVAKSTTTGYQDFKFLLETSTGNQKNPVILTSNSVQPGANVAFDLGTTSFQWNGVYARDLFISRNGQVAGDLDVTGQGDFGSLNVQDLTETRVVYTGPNGELIDSEFFTFSTIDKRLSVDNAIVKNEFRAQGNVFLGTAANNVVETTGDLTVGRDLYVAGNTAFASNTELAFAKGKIDHVIAYNIAEFRGNTFIGNANTDVLEIAASLGSGFAPTANLAYDIGKTDKRFNKMFAGEFVGNIEWSNVLSKPDPKITLNMTGDVAGSANTTLTDLTNGVINIATTVQPNSVALGTDTTGSYISTLSVGHGLDISGNTGETQNVVISHTDSSSVADTINQNSDGTVIQDFNMTFDRYGHVLTHTINSVNLDGRYSQLAFGRFGVTGYDASQDVIATTQDDKVIFEDGSGIEIAIESSDPGRISWRSTDTLDSVLGRGSVTGRDATFNGTLTANNVSMKGSLTVDGNLVVNGTTSFVNTETVTIADNIILLNSNETGSPSQDAGFEVERGTSTNVKFVWDESANRFTTDGQDLHAARFIGTLAGNASTATNADYATNAGDASYATNAGTASVANKWSSSRRISLSGDLSGSVDIDGSSNVTLSASVANDSHTHDGRYYTQGQSDGRYARNSGDTLSGTYNFTGNLRVNNNNVWHTGNDGSGSGMDSDTVDGQHAWEFLNRSGGSMTGTLNMNGQSLTNVNAVIFGSNTSSDYIKWNTGSGLEFYENGSFRGRVGPNTDLHSGAKVAGKEIVFADIGGNDIGCFMFAKKVVGSNVGWGDTTFGNNLTPSNTGNGGSDQFSPTGTWRCRGNGQANESTLWQRIA